MDEKNCRNCEHFVKHLILYNDRLIYRNGLGHCNNYDVDKKTFDKAKKLDTACPHWQKPENQAEKRMRSIQCALNEMTDKLEDIKRILIFDSENKT